MTGDTAHPSSGSFDRRSASKTAATVGAIVWTAPTALSTGVSVQDGTFTPSRCAAMSLEARKRLSATGTCTPTGADWTAVVGGTVEGTCGSSEPFETAEGSNRFGPLTLNRDERETLGPGTETQFFSCGPTPGREPFAGDFSSPCCAAPTLAATSPSSACRSRSAATTPATTRPADRHVRPLTTRRQGARGSSRLDQYDIVVHCRDRHSGSEEPTQPASVRSDGPFTGLPPWVALVRLRFVSAERNRHRVGV